MNQEQLNLIFKLIKAGAPALADELCTSLVNLVNAYNELKNEKNKKEA